MEAALSPKPRKAAAIGASVADGSGEFGFLASMAAGEGGVGAGTATPVVARAGVDLGCLLAQETGKKA